MSVLTAFASPFRVPNDLVRCNSMRQKVRTPACSLTRTLVVGANRGVGLCLARTLKDDPNFAVIMSHRRKQGEDLPDEFKQTEFVAFDVRDREAVLRSIDQVRPDIVISCFGGTVFEAELPDYVGNMNLIDASVSANVKRFVLLSCLGAGDSEGTVPLQVMETMRRILEQKSLAEYYLMDSQLSWTIVRPGPLSDDPPNQDGVLTEQMQYYGTISRSELASLLVRVATSRLVSRKVLSAFERNRMLITKPYVRPLEFWEQPEVAEFAC